MMIHLTPDHPLLDVSNEHYQNQQQQGELVDSYQLLHLHPLLDLSGVLTASLVVEVDDRAKGGGGELGNVVHEDEVGVEINDVSYEEGDEVGEVVAGVVVGAIKGIADGGGDEAGDIGVVEGVDS
ncbi:unnamed protein product [Prunus armeniaca]|uniref:Uncharacterized protein n=1 Tax=Prunus armeniaca TaxID=36596 RepID=A0A6J5TMQ4_PRUAR|nr:unnamed protein product [Prunus armeniaca]